MSEKTRKIKQVIVAQPVVEGAGVRLNRVFGFMDEGEFDPFLLLDHFGSENPADYLQGFPWHPHRGMETVTYLVRGSVEHSDSLGNKGVINSGDLQWMTAGSGIIHQEMPIQTQGIMVAFQLWVNLPAAQKMNPPKYRDIAAKQVPEVKLEGGATAKVISGSLAGVKGPVTDAAVPVEYLDITLPPDSGILHVSNPDFQVFAYVFEGAGFVGNIDGTLVAAKQAVRFGEGERIVFSTKDKPLRFLLISGRPIREPIAWQGPIVMNTKEELRTAFREYQEGTFIKEDLSASF